MNVRVARMLAPLALAAVGVAVLAAAANAQTYTTTAVSAASGTTTGIPSFGSFPDLTLGDTGPYVYDLQSFLAENGYLAVYPTGYFGSMTKAAVTAYQNAHSLPATGYFGSMTKATVATWMNSKASTMAVNTGVSAAVNAGGVPTNGSSVSASMLAPLYSTGYWYRGNWYGTIPTSTQDIAGYWNNGTWYPINNVPGMSTSVATANSGTGYWYNGTWYPTSTANVGGNASIDQGSTTSLGQTNSNAGVNDAMYGISYSRWNPYGGTVATTPNNMSCGYETSSTGTVFICR